jgi:hypothetical protein
MTGPIHGRADPNPYVAAFGAAVRSLTVAARCEAYR